MFLKDVLQADCRKVMILYLQIWDSTQRSTRNFRQRGNGNGKGCFNAEGFVKGFFEEYMRRQKY